MAILCVLGLGGMLVGVMMLSARLGRFLQSEGASGG